MSKLKVYIYIFFVIPILSQKNFPIMPNPGYDSITVNSIYDNTNNNRSNPSNFSNIHPNSNSTIMTNGTIIVNTTDMKRQCNLECYTGCRVLFPEFIEQKYCIINVCKCRIIEKAEIPPSQNYIPNYELNKNSSSRIITSDVHKYSTTAFIGVDKNKSKLSENFKNGKNNSYWYWLFYVLLFLVSVLYEFCIWKYISEKNDFSLLNWIKEKFDSHKNEENNNDLTRSLL